MVGESGEDDGVAHHPLDFFYGYFSERIEELRAEPRGDVLADMAQARFPDGSEPEPVDVARIAANLFSAGQETTVRLLSTALRLICDEPGLQQRLREHRELIPRFIEETLRIESPIKGTFRLALKTTTQGGTEIPAGSTIMLLHGATGRDPRQFECPHEPGRGAHGLGGAAASVSAATWSGAYRVHEHAEAAGGGTHAGRGWLLRSAEFRAASRSPPPPRASPLPQGPRHHRRSRPAAPTPTGSR
jgi:cytochrome P450